MHKVLLGMVTYGNINFTKLAVQSIRETVKELIDFYIIVGKPGDSETLSWLSTQPDIKFKVHTKNMGFPYSVNDIYDFAWKENNYDYLILVGNDTIAYTSCIDSLIKCADSTSYECISAKQYNVKELVKDFPETDKYFLGEFKIFTDFSSAPWKKFTKYSDNLDTETMQFGALQDMCLYKKSVFDSVGYLDVNFFPAYFNDNDLAKRMVTKNIKCCALSNARYFHFWSRTIHQGDAGIGGINHLYFRANERYYIHKWGGKVGYEIVTPFTILKIDNRVNEEQVIDNWRLN